ncbi:hypothetical protein SAMD00019534_074780 [Acytostelium subglobosum LB1]|uniref:hypothetical protein n=1 Tax=Acytostelium subglobosum LB1 TaxID=1410327 RepID=UPI0006450E86|nr:hypothetical protein SAMD00019534_074780 [Acytostelium subglobosum LB1]GAM24303.1 hypothetical protein SAMD00019534_074780 [Acytostelium subglobosum LB1]|eukprot:XP_012752629.1 hypothetical protein SAMD00019534_074780 [Acytostelium subglobosum LB1]
MIVGVAFGMSRLNGMTLEIELMVTLTGKDAGGDGIGRVQVNPPPLISFLMPVQGTDPIVIYTG